MLRNDLATLPSRPEAYRAKLVLFLFLASLGMFFAASLVSYCVIRNHAFDDPVREYVPLTLPISFWASTVVLLLVSICMHRSCQMVRAQKIGAFRNWIIFSAVFALVFFAVQSFGMKSLFDTHFSTTDGSTKSYGICFTLAFVHALHVLGGVIYLSFVLFGTFSEKFDHERHWAVDNCASYWHFLGVVWIAMLVTFLVAK